MFSIYQLVYLSNLNVNRMILDYTCSNTQACGRHRRSHHFTTSISKQTSKHKKIDTLEQETYSSIPPWNSMSTDNHSPYARRVRWLWERTNHTKSSSSKHQHTNNRSKRVWNRLQNGFVMRFFTLLQFDFLLLVSS